MPTTKHLMTIKEKAAELRVTVETLRQWRLAGEGPPYVSYGGTIRYLPEPMLQDGETAA